MMIDLDAKHGVARFISFYDHISARDRIDRTLCAFTPHKAKQGLFQKAVITNFSKSFACAPQSYDCPQLVLVGQQAHHHGQDPAANHHPCFEVADVEVFQCSS